MKVGIRKFTKNEDIIRKNTTKKIRKLIARVVKPKVDIASENTKAETGSAGSERTSKQKKKYEIYKDYDYNRHLINKVFWTESEDVKLLDCINNFMEVEDIALVLNRPLYGVKTRMYKLRKSGAFDYKVYNAGLAHKKKCQFYSENSLTFAVTKRMLDSIRTYSNIIIGLNVLNESLPTGSRIVYNYISGIEKLDANSDIPNKIAKLVDTAEVDKMVDKISNILSYAKPIESAEFHKDYKVLSEIYEMYKTMKKEDSNVSLPRITERALLYLFNEYKIIVDWSTLYWTIFRFNNNQTVDDLYTPIIAEFGNNVGDEEITKLICDYLIKSHRCKYKELKEELESSNIKLQYKTTNNTNISNNAVFKTVAAIKNGACDHILTKIYKQYEFKSAKEFIDEIRRIIDTNKGIRAQGFNDDETLILVRLYKLMLKYPKVSRQKILDDFEFNNITKSRDYYYSIIRNILGLTKLYTTDKVAEYVRDIVMDNLSLVSDDEVEEMYQKLTDGYIYKGVITKDDLIYILDGIFDQKKYADIANELNEKNGTDIKDINRRIISELIKRLYKGDFERNLTESDLKSFGVKTYDDLIAKTRKYARIKTKDTAMLIEAEA